MYIKKEEFDALVKAIRMLPTGEAFDDLPFEAQMIIADADIALCHIAKRRRETNERTARYIAEKRKTDKTYAGHKYVKKGKKKK